MTSSVVRFNDVTTSQKKKRSREMGATGDFGHFRQNSLIDQAEMTEAGTEMTDKGTETAEKRRKVKKKGMRPAVLSAGICNRQALPCRGLIRKFPKLDKLIGWIKISTISTSSSTSSAECQQSLLVLPLHTTVWCVVFVSVFYCSPLLLLDYGQVPNLITEPFCLSDISH